MSVHIPFTPKHFDGGSFGTRVTPIALAVNVQPFDQYRR
jgi:hypothetical protein